jgi:hypothetical protein
MLSNKYKKGYKFMKIQILFAALICALGTFPSHATTNNLVLNGGFENPTLIDNTWSNFPSILGWSSGNLGIEVRNNVAGTAHGGKNYIELDTTGNSFISQDLNTSIGQVYNLSFWYSPRVGVPDTSNPLSFSVDGKGGKISGNGFIGNFTFPDNAWLNVLYDFTATGTTTKLKFFAEGISDGLGGSLDDVSVTAVPEPETYAMIVTGLGVMGFVARRRNKAKA